ncbi:hypothetical protein B0T18DRAFT_334134 [Schizothecium vesticola]|uniref:SET domain-containing protein n=1 Tax=Schizothecium vesticola TaxID=314040 RepID=A0AA40EIG4_9PEZI|nr:hypothetical protein B0T18DRAFT_334134 [Schizothecium vesticola]
MLLSAPQLSIYLTLIHLATGHHDIPHFRCTNNPPGPLNPLPHYKTCSPVLDNTSPPPHHPWSYPPWCTPPAGKASTAAKLCTYTVTNLRGSSRGLSLLTTPYVAASLAPHIQDPDVAWLEKQRGSRLFSASDGPFTITQAQNKGLGVFATRRIQEGETLMANTPILIRLTEQRHWRVRDVYTGLSHASTRLPRREKQALLGLSRKEDGYVVDDILRTNGFHVTVEGVDHTGLYPEIARINHACRPKYSPTTLVIEAVAYKEIQAGEEVSLSYLPMNLLSEQRAQLIQKWGFNCTCSLCNDAEACRVSDVNRGRIQDILESLDQVENRTQENLRAAVDEVEDLGKKEGLAGQIGDFYGIIADIYLKMGDLKNAREYGTMAVKMLQHYADFDNIRTSVAVAFIGKLDKAES